jgi:hypothetical protein
MKPNSATAQRFTASDYCLYNRFYGKAVSVDDKVGTVWEK